MHTIATKLKQKQCQIIWDMHQAHCKSKYVPMACSVRRNGGLYTNMNTTTLVVVKDADNETPTMSNAAISHNSRVSKTYYIPPSTK